MGTVKLRDTAALVAESARAEILARLESVIPRFRSAAQSGGYAMPESALHLPYDEALAASVQRAAKEKRTKALRYVVVVGIGGSNLGAKAVYDAVAGAFDVLEPERYPKLLWADTADPELLARLLHILKSLKDPEEVLLVVVSKSGGTVETAANAALLYAELHSHGAIARERVVCISDEDSPLAELAKQEGMAHLSIPAMVGGRYSVFSPAGLFPLAVAGFDWEALREGARDIAALCLNETVAENPAARSAALMVLHAAQGRHIHDCFLFHPELESLGKWYRQLVAESLGKEGKGVTPTVSLGSSDLHSILQLSLGGPDDKFTTFVWAENAHKGPRVPLEEENVFSGLVPPLQGKSAREIMQAILGGARYAYRRAKRPFVEMVLPDLSPHSLGQWMQWKMIEVMCAGALLGVNAFDQPNVESYKTETKKELRAGKNEATGMV